MSTTNISEFCDNCTNKSFNPNLGLVCGLTGEKPDFIDTCPSFSLDPSAKAKMEIEMEKKKEAEQVQEQEQFSVDAELLEQQNYALSITASAGSALIGAIIWGAITYFTKYQIGYMAIGVGLLVGFANRLFGKGIAIQFGIIGAVFSIIGCYLGNVFSLIVFLADEFQLSSMEVINEVGFFEIAKLTITEAEGMDFLFYALAAISGFRVSLGGPKAV